MVSVGNPLQENIAFTSVIGDTIQAMAMKVEIRNTSMAYVPANTTVSFKSSAAVTGGTLHIVWLCSYVARRFENDGICDGISWVNFNQSGDSFAFYTQGPGVGYIVDNPEMYPTCGIAYFPEPEAST